MANVSSRPLHTFLAFWHVGSANQDELRRLLETILAQAARLQRGAWRHTDDANRQSC